MKDFTKKIVFFLSVAVTAFGFTPISASANHGNALIGSNVFTSGNIKEVKPLQLDKAVEDSKSGSFLQLAGHHSHSSHASHSSHSSHRSGY
ncbi:hypothetical protein [Desulfovibrio sp. DV]|uniref:hypothetical protein n=1 Tax=Desulfovibrio sp. DV TaxID=1844708 RepID=UPI001C37A936|nr:hypothetical protein [Desulfovibrio sp. DV]